jgi:hypothetical protein
MRDIRSDLKERINLMEERIGVANAHCEKMVKRLQSERDAKIADLKAGLVMMRKLMEFEQKNIKVAPAAASPKLSLAAG